MSIPPGADDAPGRSRLHIAWKVVAVVLVLAALVVIVRLEPVRHAAMRGLIWTRDLGPWGPVCFAAIDCVGVVLLVSSTFLLAAAGFLFGMLAGFPAVTVGNTLGAVAAFALGRTLLCGWAQRKMVGHPLLQALDRTVSQKGLKVVLLIRLTPLPTVLVNYALGLTQVRTGAYVLGTVLGMIPRTILYLYLGSTARTATQVAAGEVHRGPLVWLHLGIGAAVAVAAAIFVGRLAHGALREATSAPAARN
jgi:uncharacterized membrane protein YdjX (TVP38/TMEM64 family)